MAFDFGTLLGEQGGQLAVAFGAGCVAGYGFCMRTVYKLLQTRTDKEHQECLDKITELKRENEALFYRLREVEDRVYTGQLRQLEQIRESSIRILGGEEIGRKT